MRGVLLAALAAFCCTCGPPTPKLRSPLPAPPPGRLRAFTEHTAITALAQSGQWVFGGTADGLLRWDLRAATHTWVGVDDGLPSLRIETMASSPAGALWVATPGGVARGVEGSWTVRPAAPVGTARAMLVADESTVWVGGTEGLARLTGTRWERFLVGVSVTALVGDGKKVLWVGTAGHGLLRLVPGARSAAELTLFGPGEGCRMTHVQAMLADGGLLYALGLEGSASHLVLIEGGRCHSYSAHPALEPLALLRTADAVQILTGSRLLEISRLRPNELPSLPQRFSVVAFGATSTAQHVAIKGEVVAPPPILAPPPAPSTPSPKVKPGKGRGQPAKGKVKPVVPAAPPPPPPPPPPKPKPPKPTLLPPQPIPVLTPPQQVPAEVPRLEARPIGLPLPSGVTSVMARGDELWLGTRGLGLARSGKVGVSFLRTHELTEGAERLTVACAGPRECYMATGGTQAWRFDGDHFVQAKIDPEEGARVLAVVQDHRHRVVAIHRGQSGKALRLSRLTDRAWIPIAMQELEVPHNVPEISFAVFALSGNLWIGLHYKDTDGEDRYYGAAEVDIDEAKVIYHRTYRQGQVQPPGSLAIPNDVTAVLFHPGDMWFATKSGACRVMGKSVTLFTEAQGLESELLRDIEDGQDGEIWVASNRGLGRFNGKTWRFERQGPLGAKVRALARGEHGWVWLGTHRGLVLVAGPQVEVFGTNRGLLEPEVIDVAVDSLGRVWALSPKGVTLVER